MVSKELLAKLKTSNISADGEKTKARVQELWQNASREQKREVLEFAGVKPVSVYRIYTQNRISAKMAIPIAQVLNVNPFYLIGEADERGEYTNELLNEFLIRFGYKHLITEQEAVVKKTRRKYTRRIKPDAVVVEIPESDASGQKAEAIPEAQNDEPEHAVDTPQKERAAIDDMTEEEMVALLHSELIRAKYGADGAAERLAALKRRLLSHER